MIVATTRREAWKESPRGLGPADLAMHVVLPELDGLFGGMRILHSLVFSVAVLAVVMVVTAGRKPVRRLLLGLPIGTFLHLVFDGAWTTTAAFWWPFAGASFADAALPSVQRGAWNVLLELAGLAMCTWIWRTAGLSDAAARRRVLRTGQLFAGT